MIATQQRIAELLELESTAVDGYLDVLGTDTPPIKGIGQAAMRVPLVSRIYEPIWRNFFRLAMGSNAVGVRKEKERAVASLDIREGALVLDVGCGPGLFTRAFGQAAGATGLAIGLDASPSMLAEAARTNAVGSTGFVRGDAGRLPFVDKTFDAVACFFALHFFPDAEGALVEIARVAKPGGRIAVTALAHPDVVDYPLFRRVYEIGGARSLAYHVVPDILAAAGCEITGRKSSGAVQFVTAVKR
ncbi:methyltransferase domain-containing protein [Nocardia sp. CDC153]|uniref:class I SAM-dependent methyltransferase n=1 Tax=Nocardia sp. CDC153 TaxID=3112167 RepID=UPI002DBD42EE|nr:methyltransferase domain-containing protein [Nocardia sp. CDC153]MEC3956912.1 methyltransferase domain-containing protein [Nocardia sp. CDC153]